MLRTYYRITYFGTGTHQADPLTFETYKEAAAKWEEIKADSMRSASLFTLVTIIDEGE